MESLIDVWHKWIGINSKWGVELKIFEHQLLMQYLLIANDLTTQNASPAQDASFDTSFVPIGVILPTIGSFEDGYTSVYSFNLVIDIIVTA